jgi:hypothetical protein
MNSTYHQILTLRILGTFRPVMITFGNNGEGVHDIILDARNDDVGWEREVSSGHHSGDRTYVQDLKNVFEVQPPGGDRLFMFLHVEKLRDHIPFTPLDQILLDICHCPAIERVYISGRLVEMRVAGLTHSVN